MQDEEMTYPSWSLKPLMQDASLPPGFYHYDQLPRTSAAPPVAVEKKELKDDPPPLKLSNFAAGLERSARGKLALENCKPGSKSARGSRTRLPQL
jgi:hypothetical protein